MSNSTGVSDNGSGYTDDASTIYMSTKEQEARERRDQMVQHAAFRRFCWYILLRPLAYSIFLSLGAEITRQGLIGKGKSRQVDWMSPLSWKEVNLVLPGPGWEYRQHRADECDLWISTEEVTYEGGLTSGFSTSTDEWAMRVQWRPFEVYNETRTSMNDHRKEYTVYCRAFRNDHINRRHRVENEPHMGDCHQEIVQYDDGTEAYETTYDTTSVWELDEDTPWKYMISKKKEQIAKFYPKLKLAVEENRDPRVAAMKERLFVGSLPPPSLRVKDKKVAYGLVHTYYPRSVHPYEHPEAPTKIRFNPSVYIHADAMDEEDGPFSVPMSRSTPIHDARHYLLRYAPSTPVRNVYKPDLQYLAPGSFRVPIAGIARMEEQRKTRISTQTAFQAHARAPSNFRSKGRRIPKARSSLKMMIRLYEEACLLHETVHAQAFADEVLDHRPDWGVMMGAAIEEALAKTGWDRGSVRTGVKPPPPPKANKTVGEFIRPMLHSLAALPKRLGIVPPTPPLSVNNDTDQDSNFSADWLRPSDPLINRGLNIDLRGSSSQIMETTRSDESLARRSYRWIHIHSNFLSSSMFAQGSHSNSIDG